MSFGFHIVRFIRLPGRLIFDWLDKRKISQYFYPLAFLVFRSDKYLQRRYISYLLNNYEPHEICWRGYQILTGVNDGHAKIWFMENFFDIDYLRLVFDKIGDFKVRGFLESHSSDLRSLYTKKKNYSELIFDFYNIKPPSALWQHGLKSILKRGRPSVCEFRSPQLVPEEGHLDKFSLPLTESQIFEFETVSLIGGCQMLKDNSLILYEESAHPKYGVIAGVWPYVKIGDEGHRTAFVKYEANKRKKIEKAVLLGGRSSTNYFHWLIEYMPRFYDIHAENCLANTPLLVPEKLSDQLYEVLSILNIHKARVIKLEANVIYEVSQLFVPKLHSNIIDDLDVEFWRSGGYSEEHLSYVRRLVLNYCSKKGVVLTGPSKIFISRRGGSRGLSNLTEIESLFRNKGFKIVYPEKLSFIEQVSVFNSADIIAGPGGAAFANILFCKSGAKVVVFSSEIYKKFCLFSNIDKAVDFCYYALTGPNDKDECEFSDYLSYAVSNYSIAVSKVEYLFENILNSNVERDISG